MQAVPGPQRPGPPARCDDAPKPSSGAVQIRQPVAVVVHVRPVVLADRQRHLARRRTQVTTAPGAFSYVAVRVRAIQHRDLRAAPGDFTQARRVAFHQPASVRFGTTTERRRIALPLESARSCSHGTPGRSPAPSSCRNAFRSVETEELVDDPKAVRIRVEQRVGVVAVPAEPAGSSGSEVEICPCLVVRGCGSRCPRCPLSTVIVFDFIGSKPRRPCTWSDHSGQRLAEEGGAARSRPCGSGHVLRAADLGSPGCRAGWRRRR